MALNARRALPHAVSSVGCLLTAFILVSAQPGPTVRPVPKFQEETLVGRQVAVGLDDTVVLRNRFGNVLVQGNAGAEAGISAELIAGSDSKNDARSFLHQMMLAVVPGERKVSISIDFPENGKATEFQSNFTLNLPACALLRIENTYGDVTVDDVKAAVLVHNRFGSASVYNCRTAEITNAFGDVNVTGIEERVEVDGRFGNVNARSVQGRIRISNENGALRLTGGNGQIQLENTLGDLSVSSSHGRFKIASNRGNVTFGQNVAASDTVLVTCRNGGIQLDLPAHPSAQITARAGRGKINSGVPDSKPGAYGDDGQSLTCTLGQARSAFELETFSGDITIKTAP
jgi:hypothetical protein